MYARETTDASPIATFNNNAAIGEMARRQGTVYDSNVSHRIPQQAPSEEVQTESEPEMKASANEVSKAVSADTKKSECGIKKFIERISSEDLLLLFLIILFLFDGNTENDFMIPILLFLILLN